LAEEATNGRVIFMRMQSQVIRMPWWQKLLFALLIVPVLIALLPLTLYLVYRARKTMKQVEKEWRAQARASNHFEATIVDVTEPSRRSLPR